MDNPLTRQIISSLKRFVIWLEEYGETSYDHQSYYSGPIGGRAKSLYYRKPCVGIFAVAPMVFSEAFLPQARKLFWRRQRLPIADAHYAMGYAFLASLTGESKYYDRAIHFLDVLLQTRCLDYQNYGWGYPFDWITRNGVIRKGEPLITTTPYVFEAFSQLYEMDRDDRWLQAMHSIAEHVYHDYKDFERGSNAATCSYTPLGGEGVVNASAYRAFTLASAFSYFSENKYLKTAEKNLNFVLLSQKENGSWYYAEDGDGRCFVDHFHTCFVLKALAKIEKILGNQGCVNAIDAGIKYYLDNLFDEDNLPKPFAKAPRQTVYKYELYDMAECINLGILLRGKFKEFDETVDAVVRNVLHNWQNNDGSFYSRKLLFGFDKVPMHRWAQSQLFRSLSYYAYQIE